MHAPLCLKFKVRLYPVGGTKEGVRVEGYIPDGMDCDLLAQQLVKRTLYKGTANDLSSPFKQLVEFLDMMTPGDAEKFKHWLVILEGENSLVA
jgi:hypothetical protein